MVWVTPGDVKKLSHAGGVVFRPATAAPSFLVVQSATNPDDWVLPKGHIEPGETPEETAVREVQEEAGVDAEVIEAVGDSEFVAPRGAVTARFYLMRERGAVAAIEDRAIAWLPYEHARARLTFEDQRVLLDTANRLLGSRGG